MRLLLCAVLALLPLLSSAARAEIPTFRMGWINTPASLIPVMFTPPGVAQHLGKTYNIDAQYFRSSNLQVAALAAGELDIAAFGYSSFPIAVENARMSDLRIIADETQDGVPGWHSMAYMVRKDSPIQSVNDLKGRVVATNGIGSGVYVAMTAVLKKAGLQEKRDYTVIEVGFPNMNAMLFDGKTDLITASHPFDYDPHLLADGRILFRSRDGLGAGELSFWAAKAPFIAQNKAALTDMIEDYIRAIRWYLDPANRKEAIAIIAKATKQPEAQFESWLFTHNDYYRDPNAFVDMKALQANIDQQVAMGMLRKTINAEAYADLSMVREAAARQGVK